jgi:myo-inositol 2-dehydrogenase / D-chiro-inositol 1-dehydrogenase
MVGIAVLGCGRIGRIHARNLARHPRARLLMVFDVLAEAAQAPQARAREGHLSNFDSGFAERYFAAIMEPLGLSGAPARTAI